MLIDQVIEANLDALFPGMEILEHHLFRVTRNADLAIEEDEADDLLMAIEEELRRRRFGEAVRLEVERSMPAGDAACSCCAAWAWHEADVLRGPRHARPHRACASIADLDRPDLKLPPWTPVTPPRLLPPDEDEPADVFAAIRAGDILVHHPYESFAASVERFIAQAADDPDVLTIKQTLYRTSGDSPIVADADPGRRARQAGRRAGRDQGPLRRGGEHRLGPQARAGRRARRLRPGRASRRTRKTALVVRREGPRPAPLRPHRDRQLQPARRRACTSTSAC